MNDSVPLTRLKFEQVVDSWKEGPGWRKLVTDGMSLGVTPSYTLDPSYYGSILFPVYYYVYCPVSCMQCCELICL